MKQDTIENKIKKLYPQFIEVHFMQGNKERNYFRAYTEKGVTHIVEVINEKKLRVVTYVFQASVSLEKK